MSKLRLEEIEDFKVLDGEAMRRLGGGMPGGFPFRQSGFSRDLHRQLSTMMPPGMHSPGFPFASENGSESESWSDGYHSYQSDSQYYSTEHAQVSELEL